MISWLLFEALLVTPFVWNPHKNPFPHTCLCTDGYPNSSAPEKGIHTRSGKEPWEERLRGFEGVN